MARFTRQFGSSAHAFGLGRARTMGFGAGQVSDKSEADNPYSSGEHRTMWLEAFRRGRDKLTGIKQEAPQTPEETPP